LQEAALGLGVRELERAFVLRARFVAAAEAAEQVGARGVEVLVVGEVEPVDQGKPCFASVGLGYGDRAVQLHDGRACQPDELPVQGGDLRPVARLLRVQRRDRRLDDVLPAAPQREGALERLPSASDLRGVPARAILVCEQHQLATVEPGLAARVVEQHQRV
jgi:hypothetical protein